MEESEAGEIKYEIVEEFLMSLKKKFRREEEESVKVAELRKLEQRKKMMEQFVQEFKRTARESGYEGRPLVKEFKRGINGEIRRKLMEVENSLAFIDQRAGTGYGISPRRVMEIDRRRNFYACRGFGYMVCHCRNWGQRERVAKERRLEYRGGRIKGINEHLDNLKGVENLESLNQILVTNLMYQLCKQMLVHQIQREVRNLIIWSFRDRKLFEKSIGLAEEQHYPLRKCLV